MANIKLVIFYGTNRRGNTYKAVQICKDELIKHNKDIEFKEYFLPKDLPMFCTGCRNCFMKDENLCPHREYMEPITKDLDNCDGIIFSSPVYVLGESAALKNLLDHLGYYFLVHRPKLFKKPTFIITTTAGAGKKTLYKSIYKSLKYWGTNKPIYTGITMMAENWDSTKNRQRKEEYIKRASLKFLKLVTSYSASENKEKRNLFTIFIMSIMKTAINKYDDDNVDKKYWIKKGFIK